MPISSTGSSKRGVTLIELMVVLAIITLILGIAFPSTMAGLENVRLASGARSVAAFMNAGVNRAQRLQQAMELTVSVSSNAITLRSADATFFKQLNLPQGITVQSVTPAPPDPADDPRQFLFLPGGTPPRVGIVLANHRGLRRVVRLNPITGITEIEQLARP